MEKFRFSSWRSRLTDQVIGERALEAGVGTGKNFPSYPRDVKITAVDLSPRMLEQARKRASRMGLEVEIREMDVQRLSFPDFTFDTVFAAFLFCSVPNPVLGLKELRRVCKPADRLLLLEHMRPHNPILGLFFDLLNPFVVRVVGANINQKTVENIRMAGWHIVSEERLSSDIVRWIEAKPGL
jgi:ubiquinone/menaquinone biosynthesis C-methylase UbiE